MAYISWSLDFEKKTKKESSSNFNVVGRKILNFFKDFVAHEIVMI
jgi:hypothetical protein